MAVAMITSEFNFLQTCGCCKVPILFFYLFVVVVNILHEKKKKTTTKHILKESKYIRILF